MKKELARLLDELIEMWLTRVEFIHEKGLDDEYIEWLTGKCFVSNLHHLKLTQ